jgi:taurine transport system permease protein
LQKLQRAQAGRIRRMTMPGEGSTTNISIVTVVVLAFLWWLATHLGWLPPLVLPAPEAVWNAFVAANQGKLQGGKTLFEHFGWSFARVFGAFFLACVTAVPVGIAMGVSRIARGVFDPPIEFYRPLPPLAYLPLVIIWFGIEEASKVVLIYLACFAPLAVAARAGVRSATVEQVNVARSMGASQWQVVRHVILPAALPEILTGMRIAIGFGWTTLVAAEMVAATAGLGQMVLNASNFLRTDVVVMGIVVIGVIAYVFDMLMRQVERWLVPWKGKM